MSCCFTIDRQTVWQWCGCNVLYVADRGDQDNLVSTVNHTHDWPVQTRTNAATYGDGLAPILHVWPSQIQYSSPPVWSGVVCARRQTAREDDPLVYLRKL